MLRLSMVASLRPILLGSKPLKAYAIKRHPTGGAVSKPRSLASKCDVRVKPENEASRPVNAECAKPALALDATRWPAMGNDPSNVG